MTFLRTLDEFALGEFGGISWMLSFGVWMMMMCFGGFRVLIGGIDFVLTLVLCNRDFGGLGIFFQKTLIVFDINFKFRSYMNLNLEATSLHW